MAVPLPRLRVRSAVDTWEMKSQNVINKDEPVSLATSCAPHRRGCPPVAAPPIPKPMHSLAYGGGTLRHHGQAGHQPQAQSVGLAMQGSDGHRRGSDACDAQLMNSRQVKPRPTSQTNSTRIRRLFDSAEGQGLCAFKRPSADCRLPVTACSEPALPRPNGGMLT